MALYIRHPIVLIFLTFFSIVVQLQPVACQWRSLADTIGCSLEGFDMCSFCSSLSQLPMLSFHHQTKCIQCHIQQTHRRTTVRLATLRRCRPHFKIPTPQSSSTSCWLSSGSLCFYIASTSLFGDKTQTARRHAAAPTLRMCQVRRRQRRCTAPQSRRRRMMAGITFIILVRRRMTIRRCTIPRRRRIRDTRTIHERGLRAAASLTRHKVGYRNVYGVIPDHVSIQ